MQPLLTATVTALLITTLAGCASMSEEECLAADWRTIGVEDGARGRGPEAIAGHRKACAKAGVTPNLVDYENGRQEGLTQFCRPARGYEFGSQGGSYEGVCPADLEADFLEAYNDGRGYYELAQAVETTESALNSLGYQLDKARDDIREREEWLRADNITDSDRAALQDKLRELNQQIGRLESKQNQLLVQLGERREKLRSYERGRY